MNRGLKTFEVRSVVFTETDNAALGGTDSNPHAQGSIFVKAESKAEALATLKSFDYPTPTMECRVGRGDGMDALLDAGVITTGTLTFVDPNYRNVGKLSFTETGEKEAVTAGHLIPRQGDNHYGMEFMKS